MVRSENAKWLNALAPVSANGAYTCLVIDTLGFDYCEVIVNLGLVGAADFTALKITEADVAASATALTSPNDVTGLIVGTSLNTDGVASTFPGDTADGKLIAFSIDLKKRKRYLLLSATSGAAALMSAVARLSRGEQSPRTLAERGLLQHLEA